MSCAHGVCSRIVDTMFGKHRQVSISDASPANFSDEFSGAVKQAVRVLPLAEQREIRNFQDTVANVGVTVNRERKLIFTTNGADNFPAPYKKILFDVTKDLNHRFNYLNPNGRLQIVKENDAINVFRNLEYIDFNN